MQVDLLGSAQSAHALHLFHQHSPLVHCMTNDVVQTFTANTLLALGASPAMVIETEEASQFAAIASALLINVGTLTQPRAQAMRAAVEQAKSSQTPWTLDQRITTVNTNDTMSIGNIIHLASDHDDCASFPCQCLCSGYRVSCGVSGIHSPSAISNAS